VRGGARLPTTVEPMMSPSNMLLVATFSSVALSMKAATLQLPAAAV
jgi:hypothetical protein